MAREELSSLQMLEESAAQLAALRQRAEFLLEQMAASTDSDSTRDSTEGIASAPTREAEDQQEPVLHSGQTVQPGLESAPTPDQIQSDAAVPDASVPGSATSGSPDPAAESRQWSQPSIRQDTEPNSGTFSRQGFLDQSPRKVDQSDGEDLPHIQSGQGPADQTRPQEPQFPIQNTRTQSESLLDNPVTVAPPPEWLQFQVAPESLSSDAQLIEEEITGLYEAIERFRETRRENTGHALSLLREAREIIAGQPHRIERAQYNIQQARQIIERAKSSRSRSRGIALRTFGLLILWLAALGGLGAALYLYPLDVNEIILVISSSTGWNTSHYYSLLWTVASGGIGGWLGTVSFLFERMRVHEEFDRQYILRSTIQPLMGVVLGLVCYGLLAVLFNSLNASIIGHPVTAYLPAALALPVGLWQVYVYAGIFRVTLLLTFQRRRRW